MEQASRLPSRRIGICAAASLLLTLCIPAFGLEGTYTAALDPVAHDNSTRANVVGEGDVTAALSGRTLSIRGRFSGLASPATAAHLQMGLATGVPGPAIADLSATSGTGGTISGSVTLSPAQLSRLAAGGLYVQIDSVKAPGGTLWGWLLPTSGAQ